MKYSTASIIALATGSLAAPSTSYQISGRKPSFSEGSSTDLNAVIASSAPISSVFSTYNLTHDSLGATVFALLYGYGFPSYIQEFGGINEGNINHVITSGSLANATSTTIVRPNVDTIYAASFLDFSSEDLVLTVPEMQPDRYYVFAFYDPFGDNFASIGSRNANPPGKYLIKPSLLSNTSGLITDPDACDGYAGIVSSPTLDATLLIRVEVKNNNTDVTYVDSYLKDVTLNSTNTHPPAANPLTTADVQGLPSTFEGQILELIARLGARTPPQDPDLAAAVSKVFSYAGINISNGIYTPIPGVNITAAGLTANATLHDFYYSPAGRQPLSNGWTQLDPTIIGNYTNGTALVFRAFVAETGYLGNTADQSIYPSSPNTTYSLSNEEALLITFVDGKPPLMSDGFWSLTMYNSVGYLVENKLGVYSVGDRSNLTYPDGGSVYANGTAGDASEPFQILVQPADVAPPSNWTGNWLPSPTGMDFELTLRFYAPEEALVNGSYGYPSLERVGAIVG